MSLKIAFITDAWHPQINGVVTTITQTCSMLEELGHRLELITPDRFKTIPCPTYPSIRLALNSRHKVYQLLDEFCPEHIHIATEGPLGFAARRYCLERKLAFTTSFHTLFAEYVNLRFKLPLSWGYWLLCRFHAPAAKVMVATPMVEANLRARGFKNPLVRWTRGVDSELFRPADKSFLDLQRPIALCAGRVAVEKNLREFLSLDMPGSKVVVGDGPQLKALKKEFPQAVFTGFKVGEALVRHIAAADVFVFPSRTDTFGIVLLEALACGVPVAAFPVQGPLDVIVDPKVGSLKNDLKQAVTEALSLNPEDCRNFALKFSWQNCSRQFLGQLVPVHNSEAVKRISREFAG